MSKIQNPQLWLVVLLSALLSVGCGENTKTEISADPPLVEVMVVQPQPYTLTRELPGRIEAVRVAEVRARVPGIILQRHFEEGSEVEEGQALFSIDPAPLEIALSQAEAEHAKAEAELANAQAVVNRYHSLKGVAALSDHDLEAAEATLNSARAIRQSTAAQVDAARLNLTYAAVKAPISGRIGRAQVTEGALVGQGEPTPLATIQQLDPVYVDFKQPIAEMLRLRTAVSAGQLVDGGIKGARITITAEGMDDQPEGYLLFTDSTIERSTGQVSLRGLLPNPEGHLLPGMFVRVRMSQGVDSQAIVVPQRVVRRSSDSAAQVWVVDDDDRVAIRAIETGATDGTNWHVASGLQPGDRVIVSGAAEPGRQVRVEILSDTLLSD